ncbi:hypothetical protein D3C79_874900 [compost metagenome]
MLQRLDHRRRINARSALTNGELGRHRRIGQRLVQFHAGADQLVDQVGHVIARHPGVGGRVDHRPGQLLLLRLVDDIGLDRNVTDDRLIVRADHRRHGGGACSDHSLANVRLQRRLARLQLLVTL